MSFLSELGSNITDLASLDSSVLQGLLDSGLGAGTNGGVDYDDQGAPIMFRDSHLASMYSSASDLWTTSRPRAKYSYFINFVTAVTSNSLINVLDSGTDLSTMSYIVHSIDRPTVTMNTRTLNQYNKKRIIHTGREYHPINCEFWDTTDSRFYQAFKQYFNYYYGDSLNTDYTAWINDTTSSTFNAGANGWGYVPPANGALNTSSFLSRIEVYEMSGGSYRAYVLTNPKFREVKYDRLGYGETSDLSKVSVEIEYEGICYYTDSARVNDNYELTELMYSEYSSFYEPTSMSVSDTGLYSAPTATFNDLSADTSITAQSDESGLSSAYYTNSTMDSISGNSGIFNNSLTSVVGNFLTQNSGTLSQATGGSSTLTSLTRGLSIMGGLY